MHIFQIITYELIHRHSPRLRRITVDYFLDNIIVLLYKASCWDCDSFYIGKTKRRLHDRKSEHFKALTQVGHASAVADHTISTGHNIKWDHFEILATGKSDLQCKIKETLLISDLKPSLNENIGSEKLFLY